MIRKETPEDWILVTHPDHAALAGQIADAWGNALFPKPEPYSHIQYAVYHHDDGWLARDAEPSLTRNNHPEAFTRKLVGAYSAFEEIDLPAYLKVRAQATAGVAAVDPYAGIVVSMHTHNLLSEQADITSIRPEHRAPHADFLNAQKSWQHETAVKIGAQAESLQRGFEFLQLCDNLSLIACSGYEEPITLRHTHPDRTGRRHGIRCTLLRPGVYHLAPWPFAADTVEFTIPVRHVNKNKLDTLETFRAAFKQAPVTHEHITLVSDAAA